MKSHESYKKEYPESAKQKFAIPRDAEGKPNQEIFGITRDFVEKLSKYPSFIGAAPYGSKMKGYSVEDSDTDIAIFTELPKDITSVEENIERSELRREALEASYGHGGPDAVHIEYHDLDEGTIRRAIVDSNNYPTRIALVNFFGIVAGPKVEEYRKIIAKHINALSEDKRETFIHELVLMALSLENIRKVAIEERIPSTKEAGMITTRRAVWEKRINDVLKNTI